MILICNPLRSSCGHDPYHCKVSRAVQKLEWKETDRQTDTTDLIAFLANTVVKLRVQVTIKSQVKGLTRLSIVILSLVYQMSACSPLVAHTLDNVVNFEVSNITEHEISEGIIILISASTLYGPMHTKSGVQEYVDAVEEIRKQGGQIAFGGKVLIIF